MKKAIGILLIFVAICCAVIMSAKRVPKEKVRTTKTTTTETETEETTTSESETSEADGTITDAPTTTTRIEPFDGEYISPEYFHKMGVISDGNYNYTWYSENVLPGRGLNIPGRHSDGNYVRDENGYLVLASSDLLRGTIVETPFGTGKVYDTGCPHGVIDVYTSW